MRRGCPSRSSATIDSSHGSDRDLRSVGGAPAAAEASRRWRGTATSPAPRRSSTSPSRRCRTRSAGSRQELGRRCSSAPAGASRRPRRARRSPLAPAASWRRSTPPARRSTSCAASCAGASGSGRCCPPATSTSRAARPLQPAPIRASRSACARASPPTCCAFSPPTSSTPRSACSPATIARRARVRAARPRGGRRRLRPGPRPTGAERHRRRPVRAPDRRDAPRLGHHLRAGARFADAGEPLRLALESGDPFLLRALAARGFATAILPRSLTAPGRTRRRGAKPGPRRSSSPSRSSGAASAAPRRRRAAFIDFVRGEASPRWRARSRRPGAASAPRPPR